MILKRKNYFSFVEDGEERNFTSIRKLKKAIDGAGREMINLSKNSPGLTQSGAKGIIRKYSNNYKQIRNSMNKLDNKLASGGTIPSSLTSNRSQIAGKIEGVNNIIKSSFKSI